MALPRLPPFDFQKMLQIMFVAIMVLFLLYSFIDVSAVSSGSGGILKSNVDINSVVFGFFTMVVLFFAVWFSMGIIDKANESHFRMDKTFFISVIVFTVIIYVVYSYVAQPLICGAFTKDAATCALPSLKVMALEIYSVTPAPIQSIFGLV
jgi:hypothetical protein